MTRNRSPATMRRDSHTAWWIAAVGGLLAAWLRWYFVTHAQVLQPLDIVQVRGDAVDYYRYAWNLAHHGIFSSAVPGTPAPQADSFRDPGYPLFLAGLMLIFPNYGSWYAAALLTQAALGGITVACLVLAFRRALPPWLLGVVAIMTAAWPHLVSVSAYVLSENLLLMLMASLLLAVGEAAERPRPARWLCAGIVFALAGLTNAVVAPLVVPVALVLRWKRAVSGRQAAALLLAALIPLAAWSLRNASLSADASSSYRAEQNLVQGSWPIYHQAYQLSARGDADGVRAMSDINGEINLLHAAPRQGLRAMAERMSAQPWTYVRWYLSKPATLWGWDILMGQGDIYVYPTRNSPYMTQPLLKGVENLAFLLNPLLAVLALAGLAMALARRTTPAAVITAAVSAAWVTLVYATLQSEPRYAIPFRGIEIALACFAMAQGAAWWRHRQRSPGNAT